MRDKTAKYSGIVSLIESLLSGRKIKEENTHVRDMVVQNFRERFVEFHRIQIEAGSVQEQTVNVNTIVGRCSEFFFLQRFEIVDEEIYRYHIFPRVILTRTREERLREIETGDPKCRWLPLYEPFLRGKSNNIFLFPFEILKRVRLRGSFKLFSLLRVSFFFINDCNFNPLS